MRAKLGRRTWCEGIWNDQIWEKAALKKKTDTSSGLQKMTVVDPIWHNAKQGTQRNILCSNEGWPLFPHFPDQKLQYHLYFQQVQGSCY